MANKSIIPTAVAGAASLAIGIGAPQLITGTPLWVSYALVGLGAVLLLVAAGLRWVRFGSGGSDTGGVHQTSHGPNSPNFGGSTFLGPVTFGTPPPAEKQPRKSPHGEYDIEKLNRGLERVLGGLSSHPAPPTAWRDISGHPPRQADLPLNGLLVRVYGDYRKKGRVVPKGGKALADFQRSINLKIADTVKLNKLHVWARLGDRALELISEYDWSVGTFDHVKKSLFVPAPYADGAEYTDLHFSKAEIDRVWPEDDDDGQQQQ